jgi:ferric iron reductase protein FhuF
MTDPTPAVGPGDAAELIERIVGAVDYLRLHPEPGADRQWQACRPLVDDPDELTDLVRSTMAGRGTDRLDVATSLFVQGYAFRIASAAIGGWLLADAVLDLSPTTTSIALGRHRPNAVALHGPRLAATGATVADLHHHLIEGHLAPLVESAHTACRIGRPLLWANVGAGCASSFGAFMDPLPDRRLDIRARAIEFFDRARPELAASGRLVPIGPLWAWERSACCLWYRTDSGFKCEDCSLWSAEEKADRRNRILARIGSETG